ncbi:MAG: 16S rRNA (adenine(1518)-N(6)/adenine(1519)-N(6))-dimethyltransferase, partial [Chloroflexota bacterium]|nr:16S rRNA (adenine(1518)-N(6)/adenine(1519)-N(6))-dimethyltransferase [Chloroflexota bacterium]
YITSHALRRLLELAPRPVLIVVMVQLEVARRSVAGPPDMSLLAVSVQYYSRPEIVGRVPAGAFVPRPQVDSAILRMRPHQAPLFPDVPTDEFFRVASAGFRQKRKTLANSLAANLSIPKEAATLALQAAGVDPSARAERLTLEQWAALCRALLAV